MSAINYFSVPMGNGEKKGLTWIAVQKLIDNLRLPHPDSELAVQIRKEIPMTKHLYERFYERPWLYYQIIQSYAFYTAGNQSVSSFGAKYKKIPFKVRMRMDPKDAWPKLQPPTPQQWFDKERAAALIAIINLNKENALQKEELQMDDQLQELFDLATRKYRGQLDQAGSWIGSASQELAKYCRRINHKSQERQNLIALLLRHNRRIIEAHAISPMAALVEYYGNNKTFAVRLAEVFRQYVKRLEEIENELNFLLASDEMGDKKQLRAQLALMMRQVIRLRKANSGFAEHRYNLGLENQQLKSGNQQQRSRIKYLEAKAIAFARWQSWTNEEAKKAQAELQASMEAKHNRKVEELESANIQLTSMCHEVERDNDLLRTEGGTTQEVAQLKRQLEAFRRNNEQLKKQHDEAKAEADNLTKRNEIGHRQNVNLEKNADIHKKEIEKLQKQNADLMRALQQGQTAQVLRHRAHEGSDKLQLTILPPHNVKSNDRACSHERSQTPTTPSSTSSDKTFDLDDCVDKIEKAATTAEVSVSELKNFGIETLGEKYNELRVWKKAHKDGNNKLRQWHEEELIAKQVEIDSLRSNIRELESRPSFPNEQIKKLAEAEVVRNENAILRLSLADEKAQRAAAEESLDALAVSLEEQLQAKDNFYGAPGCFQAKRWLESRYNDLSARCIELWDDNDALRLTLRELDSDTGLAGVALSKLRQLHHLRSKLSEADVEIVKDLNDTLVSLTEGLRSKLRNLDLGSRMPGGLGPKLQDYDLTFKLPNGLSKQGWLLHRVHIELLMSKIGTLEGTIDDLDRAVQAKEVVVDMISDKWKALGSDGGKRWEEFEEIAHRFVNTEEVVKRMKAMLAPQTEALAEAEAAMWEMQDLQARINELEGGLASQHLNADNTDDDEDEPPRGRSPAPKPCINGLWGGYGGEASELQEIVRSLGNELADVNSRFYEVKAENSTLKSGMAQREWLIGQLQEEALRREMHIGDLRNADFEKEAQELHMRIAKLEYREAELEDELRSQHLNDEGDLTELQHTVSRQNSELTQVHLRLKDANATASRLRGIIELRDAFIREAEIEHEEELEELRETISDQKRDLTKGSSSADGLKTIISDLRGTVAQRDVDNDELKATNSGLRQAIADLKDETQELNIRILSLKRESKNMEDHFLNAQSARDILDVENYRIQKLKEEVARLQNQKEGVEKENGEVAELCNGRTRELNVTMDKYNKTKIMLHCTTKQVEVLKSKLEAAESAAADGGDKNIFREEHRRTSMLNASRRGSNLMSDSPNTPSMHPRAPAQRDGSPESRSGGLKNRRDSMSSMVAHFMPPSSPGGRMFQPSSPRASSPPARPSMRGKPSYAKSAALNSSLSLHAGQVLRSQLDTARCSLSECSPSEAEKRLKGMHGTELMEAASLVEEPPVLSSPPRQVQRDHTAEVARIKALMALNPVVKAGSLQKEARKQTQPAAETSALVSEREVVKAVEGIWERPVFVQGEEHVHSEASIEMCTPLPSPEFPKDEEAAAPTPVIPSTMDIDAANAGKIKKTASSLSLLSSNKLSKRLSRVFPKATATASATIENIAGFVGNAMTNSKSKSELKDSSVEEGESFEMSRKPTSRKGIEIFRELPDNVSAATTSCVASGVPSPSAEKTPDVVESGTRKSFTGRKGDWCSGDKPEEPAPPQFQNAATGLPLRATSGEASPASSLPAARPPTALAVNTGLRQIGTVGDLKASQISALSLAEAAASPEARVGIRKIGTVGDLRARQSPAPSPAEPSTLRGFPSLSNIRENPFMKADPKRVSSAVSASPIIIGGERTPSGEGSKRVVSGSSVKDRAAAFMGAGKENGLASKSPLIGSRRAVSETTDIGKLNTAPECTDKPRALHAPKLSPSSTPHSPKSPVESPNSQTSELSIKKLRPKISASRLPLAISGNMSISATLKSAPLKPSPLANSFRFPSDTSLASLSGKQSSEPMQSKQSASGSSLGVGPTTLEGSSVRQKLSAERTNKTLGDTSNETTTAPVQTRVVPRKPSRLPLKSSSDTRANRTVPSSEFAATRSPTPIARPATPRQVTPTDAARPSARRPTPRRESIMRTQPQPGTKQRSSPTTHSSVPPQEQKTDKSKDQEALFGQTFVPTSDAVDPSHRSSVYSEVMPSSPPIMAQYGGWEASSDYSEEADGNPVAPNHHAAIPAKQNTVAASGLRPNQAAGSNNARGASAGSLGAFSSTAAAKGHPPSSDGIAPRHPVITPSGLRRPISIGAAATLYSATASSSPRPPALPGRDLDSLPSQRNRSAPVPVEFARRPAMADRSTSQRGRPLPPQPERGQTPRENLRPVDRIEDPFITQGIRDRAHTAQAGPAENPFGQQGPGSQHPRSRPAVDDERDPYVNHSVRPLPPPQEYRQFEGNPFAAQEVKSKDKGKDKGKAAAVDQNEYPVYPSSPPRAQGQLGKLANEQFIHRESSGLPQNGQNPFAHHRDQVRGPVVNGVQYPPWDDVKPRLNDSPFTDHSCLAPQVAPAVTAPPPNLQPSQLESPQYGLPMAPRLLNADPIGGRSRLALALAPLVAPTVRSPRRNLSICERQQYILPKTRQGLENQRYEPPHVLAPDRLAEDNQAPHPHRPVSNGDSLFNFLLEDVRKPSSPIPVPAAQTPVPRHPIQQLPSSRPAPKTQTPMPRDKVAQQPSSQDRFGQRFGERFEQFDRTFNDDDIPNNMPNWDEVNTWAVPDPNVRIEGPDPGRLKQQQQPGEQKERGWKKMFSRNERPAPNSAPMAMEGPPGGPSGGLFEQRGGGSRLASIGQGLRDFGRSTSNVFRRGRHEPFIPASSPTRPPNRWGRQLLGDLNASARRLFGRGTPPLSRPLAETRIPPSHGLTGGEHGMRGRRSSARSLHTRGSRVFSPVDFGSSPPRSDSPRLDSDPPRRHPLAEGLPGIRTAEHNLRRRNSALGREAHERGWVDESGVRYDEDEISIEYNFGDRAWAIKEGKKRGRRFSQ